MNSVRTVNMWSVSTLEATPSVIPHLPIVLVEVIVDIYKFWRYTIRRRRHRHPRVFVMWPQ